MATIFDTAKYILEQKEMISPRKLQKLCYYSQAWSLVWDAAPLFEEDFQAWVGGPVCPELFHCTYGKELLDSKDIDGCSDSLTDSQKQIISTVLDYYGEKEFEWLCRLTLMESPWRNIYRGVINIGEQRVISKECIKEYYSNL